MFIHMRAEKNSFFFKTSISIKYCLIGFVSKLATNIINLFLIFQTIITTLTRLTHVSVIGVTRYYSINDPKMYCIVLNPTYICMYMEHPFTNFSVYCSVPVRFTAYLILAKCSDQKSSVKKGVWYNQYTPEWFVT